MLTRRGLLIIQRGLVITRRGLSIRRGLLITTLDVASCLRDVA